MWMRPVGPLLALMLASLSCMGGGGSDEEAEEVPVARFAYVVNEADATVSVHAVDRAGRLRFRSFVRTRHSPRAIATDPTGSWIFIGTAMRFQPFAPAAVVSYRVDPATGALTEVGWLRFSQQDEVASLAFFRDGLGPFVLVQGSFGQNLVARFDETTGQLTSGGGYSYPAIARAVDPVGRFVAMAHQTSVDIASPQGTWYSVAKPAANVVALALAPSGSMLYAAHGGSGSLSRFRIDPPSHSVTPEGTSVPTPQRDPEVLAMHPSGRFLVVSYRNSSSLSVFRIDATTGEPSFASAAKLNWEGAASLTFDAAGRFLLATHPDRTTLSVFLADEAAFTLARVEHSFVARGRPLAAAFVHGRSPPAFLPIFVVAANSQSNDLSVYAVGPNGTLTPQARVPARNGPHALAVDPLGRFLYSANHDSDQISTYRIDPASGPQPTGAPVAAGNGPTALATEPSGRFLFAAITGSNSIYVYTLDLASGAPRFTALIATPDPVRLAVNPQGNVLFALSESQATVRAFSIDPESGFLTPASGMTSLVSSFLGTGMGTDPRGSQLYLTDGDRRYLSLYVLNPPSPRSPFGNTVARPVQEAVTQGRAVDLAIDPFGRFVYTAELDGKGISIYGIEPSTHRLVPSGRVTLGILDVPSDVEVDPSGSFLYLTSRSGSVLGFRIEQTTGALTSLGAPAPAGVNPETIAFGTKYF